MKEKEATTEKDIKEEKNIKKENKKNTKELELIKENQKILEEKSLLNEKLLRVMAEMQNYKRRTEEERQKMLAYEGEGLIKKLLPVLDNFERAIKLDDENLADDLSKFLDGFKMIYGNLKNILNDIEVKEIPCINEEFDPNTMEAVMTDEIEGVDSNIVIDCMQKGYTYKDKVIRVAMVKVNK